MTPGSLPAPRPDWALFLDVDGTLLDIASAPGAVRVPPELPRLLARLRDALGGALALVSGRPVDVLDGLLHPTSLAAIGLHGAEWRARPDGPVVRDPEAAPPPAEARALLERFAAGHPGVTVEDKGLSLALHYRQAPGMAREAEAAARTAARLRPGYDMLPGKMMFEIKPAGVNKGEALRRALKQLPFAGRVAVFVGDDVTDEDGFAAVNRLGGHSIRVGGKGPTAARHHLPDASAVRHWLEQVARRLG